MTAEAASRAPTDEAGCRLLAEHLPDLIILAFDPTLTVWAATGGALRTLGWSPEEFIGLHMPGIAGSSRPEAVEAGCRAALAGSCTQLDLHGHHDPSRLWALTFVPLPDERGDITSGMVMCRDVTEQRRAEQLLQASRRQLADAQRIAQVGSWEWDLDSDQVTVSDEFRRIFGIPMGDQWTMEEGVALLIPDADRGRVEQLLDRMRRDPTPFAFEHQLVGRDGVTRTVLSRGEGVVDEHGRIVRFIGTDQDVTDRRRADADRRRLLGRVYEAQEGQDRRLAADLHDGHVQSLATIGFKLEQARLRLGASGSPPRSTSCCGRSPRTCRPR